MFINKHLCKNINIYCLYVYLLYVTVSQVPDPLRYWKIKLRGIFHGIIPAHLYEFWPLFDQYGSF